MTSDGDAVADVAWLGDCAVQLTLREPVDPREVFARLRAVPGVRDVVVTERHACAHLDPRASGSCSELVARLVAALARAPAHGALSAPARAPVAIRARYDGPDLARVADASGVSVEQLVALHTAPTYRVRFVGFLPGFAYLEALDPRITADRLPAPRARVPAGAVGIAGTRTGVYPFASPGGWNLIATAVDFVAFDPAHGARLLAGDLVRFERA